MGITETIARMIFSNRYRAIDRFCAHPAATQERVWKELIESGRDTSFGKEHGFAKIKSYGDWASSVPIRSYDELEPYVERIRNGEQNVLWNSPVRWLAKSSGTTASRSKFIPTTRDSLFGCHHKGNKDAIAIYLKRNPNANFLGGKSLILGGSNALDTHNGKIITGDLSAILISTTPSVLSIFKAPRPEIALIPDFEEKVAKICQTTVGSNITAFAGAPSWNLVLMKAVLEYTGKKNLLEVWPNLECFVHGGIRFTPYAEQYRQLIPSPDMHYMETYNASEGFFAIQDEPGGDMMLMLDYGVFYEFIPLATLNDPSTAVPLEGVKKGVNYAMIISTTGGLWRYLIGDTVTFTSLSPYRLKITGRTKHYINAFGEEIIIDNAEKAIQEACRATDAVVQEYSAGPVYMEGDRKGAHQWVIEFDRAPSDLNLFTETLDNTLRAVNSDYDAKRYKDTTLSAPIVTPVPKGTFFRWMKQKNKLGGQNKVPRLSNDRTIVDTILTSAKL